MPAKSTKSDKADNKVNKANSAAKTNKAESKQLSAMERQKLLKSLANKKNGLKMSRSNQTSKDMKMSRQDQFTETANNLYKSGQGQRGTTPFSLAQKKQILAQQQQQPNLDRETLKYAKRMVSGVDDAQRKAYISQNLHSGLEGSRSAQEIQKSLGDKLFGTGDPISVPDPSAALTEDVVGPAVQEFTKQELDNLEKQGHTVLPDLNASDL